MALSEMSQSIPRPSVRISMVERADPKESDALSRVGSRRVDGTLPQELPIRRKHGEKEEQRKDRY